MTRNPFGQNRAAPPAEVMSPDGGASTVLTMACVAVSCLAIGYTGWWARGATGATTAQVVADNAALAAAWYATNTRVTDPCEAAHDLPKPDTAQVTQCSVTTTGTATVTIAVTPTGPGGLPFLTPLHRTARAGPIPSSPIEPSPIEQGGRTSQSGD